ncbi:hypothetical protein [Massilia scottii]|uniref:hypothetical protein n=1 Tax=Massilia scottii TaxID=3057166 RepID=UPI002796404F|nr:hypothetical protein [Massilia sp. CCM 9029]MDQ1832118.1 hypothetical protein [Massilia sp. CCM 9029]
MNHAPPGTANFLNRLASHPIIVTSSYTFGVLTYQILGAVCILFSGGCAVGAFLARQYPPIAVFAFFGLMGRYMIANAGRFEISEKFITQRNLFGAFRMAWAEVRRIEFGTQGSIVLHGEHKQFALPPAAYWSGKQKPEAFDLLSKTIDSIGVIKYPSNTADYKVHKNVRVRAGEV